MANITTSNLSETIRHHYEKRLLMRVVDGITPSFCASTDAGIGVVWGDTACTTVGSLEIKRNYVEDEPDACEYCGNLSDIRDSRGNCPGCGAIRKPPKKR